MNSSTFSALISSAKPFFEHQACTTSILKYVLDSDGFELLQVVAIQKPQVPLPKSGAAKNGTTLTQGFLHPLYKIAKNMRVWPIAGTHLPQLALGVVAVLGVLWPQPLLLVNQLLKCRLHCSTAGSRDRDI
jgi:hypothetical protein